MVSQGRAIVAECTIISAWDGEEAAAYIAILGSVGFIALDCHRPGLVARKGKMPHVL